MTKKKIGRNDPCPCNSGRKYKKCCLNKMGAFSERPIPPEILLAIERQKAQDLQRSSQQGLGKRTISCVSNGYRIVAVGNRIFWDQQWKTFHDFLSAYIKDIFGPEWGNAEIAKPLQERHPILQWYNELCVLQQSTPKNGKEI